MKQKDFDCPRMKDELQRELLEEIRDLPWEERWRRAEADLAADPLLARLLVSAEDDAAPGRAGGAGRPG